MFGHRGQAWWDVHDSRGRRPVTAEGDGQHGGAGRGRIRHEFFI